MDTLKKQKNTGSVLLSPPLQIPILVHSLFMSFWDNEKIRTKMQLHSLKKKFIYKQPRPPLPPLKKQHYLCDLQQCCLSINTLFHVPHKLLFSIFFFFMFVSPSRHILTDFTVIEYGILSYFTLLT